MASGGRDLQDIPLTDIITKQPRTSPEHHNQNQNSQSNGGDDETNVLTGLGPMRDSNTFKIKQKIRLKDICGEVCGCEVT